MKLQAFLNRLGVNICFFSHYGFNFDGFAETAFNESGKAIILPLRNNSHFSCVN